MQEQEIRKALAALVNVATLLGDEQLGMELKSLKETASFVGGAARGHEEARGYLAIHEAALEIANAKRSPYECAHEVRGTCRVDVMRRAVEALKGSEAPKTAPRTEVHLVEGPEGRRLCGAISGPYIHEELQPAPAEQKIGPVVFLEHVALVTIAGEVCRRAEVARARRDPGDADRADRLEQAAHHMLAVCGVKPTGPAWSPVSSVSSGGATAVVEELVHAAAPSDPEKVAGWAEHRVRFEAAAATRGDAQHLAGWLVEARRQHAQRRGVQGEGGIGVSLRGTEARAAAPPVHEVTPEELRVLSHLYGALTRDRERLMERDANGDRLDIYAAQRMAATVRSFLDLLDKGMTSERSALDVWHRGMDVEPETAPRG